MDTRNKKHLIEVAGNTIKANEAALEAAKFMMVEIQLMKGHVSETTYNKVSSAVRDVIDSTEYTVFLARDAMLQILIAVNGRMEK